MTLLQYHPHSTSRVAQALKVWASGSIVLCFVACSGGSETGSSSDVPVDAARFGQTNKGSTVPQTTIVPDSAFNANDWPSDTTGTLPGTVLFAQSQIFPSTPRIAGDVQPHLAGMRDTLVLYKVKPEVVLDSSGIALQAYDARGTLLGTLKMAHPNDIPKQPNFLTNIDVKQLVFPTALQAPFIVSGNANLAKLNDPTSSYLKGILTSNAEVEIQLADGAWTDTIYLPDGDYSSKKILIKSTAGYGAKVVYKNKQGDTAQASISQGTVLPFLNKGAWFNKNDADNSLYVYGHRFWSAALPPHWLKPGLRLEFVQGNKRGILNPTVGAPTELLMHTIDLGMLTPPRNEFAFAKDALAHKEYFQTIPVSRLVVSPYESAYFTEVMMPDGRLLRDKDPSEGGWHTGEMRQAIGKVLISHGINNANYGMSSSSSVSESAHPFWAAQLTAHNSVGIYSNGRQVHGGSGGAGMVTLDSSIGNEFSHEVGHNFGLGHYPGGAAGSIHGPANAINSSWAWDSKRNQLLPNFSPRGAGQALCYPTDSNQCVQPFMGHTFGWDSMAGGEPLWPQVNRFTMYTPYSVSNLQNFLENKAVFSKDSSTGFRKWNSLTARMDPIELRLPYLDTLAANPARLSSVQNSVWVADTAYIQSLFDQGADIVSIAMADGYWSRLMSAPVANASNQGKYINIEHNAGYESVLRINNTERIFRRGDKQTYVSDGRQWTAVAFPNTTSPRKPQYFGVPVTTLVGYYDPQAQLSSHVFPALHGAYGFVYPDESAQLSSTTCQLIVSTRYGERRYRLNSVRADAGLMNKFHVNVPQSEGAQSATVRCQGQALAQRNLAAPQTTLSPSVSGLPLP